MIKKLIKRGNSWSLTFTTDMVSLLKLDTEKPSIDIEFVKDKMIIKKAIKNDQD